MEFIVEIVSKLFHCVIFFTIFVKFQNYSVTKVTAFWEIFTPDLWTQSCLETWFTFFHYLTHEKRWWFLAKVKLPTWKQLHIKSYKKLLGGMFLLWCTTSIFGFMLEVLLLPWSSKCIINPCSHMKKIPKLLQRYIFYKFLQIKLFLSTSFLSASRSYFFLPLPNPPFLIFYMNYIEYVRIWIHNSHLPQLNANCKNTFFCATNCCWYWLCSLTCRIQMHFFTIVSEIPQVYLYLLVKIAFEFYTFLTLHKIQIRLLFSTFKIQTYECQMGLTLKLPAYLVLTILNIVLIFNLLHSFLLESSVVATE